MNNLRNIITLALLCVTAVFTAGAQNSTVTPYSRFGYGVLGDNVSSMQRGMGGVGYAMNSGRQINVMNPASYAMIDSLTFLFDMGGNVKQVWTKDGSQTGRDFTGGLDYITMQFPICRGVGASVGLVPFSEVGYSYGDEVVNGEASRQGSGGINQAYLGVAARPFKGFGIGVNVGYLFGTLINDNYAMLSAGGSTLFERVMKVRDYNISVGAQYSLPIGRTHRVTLGLTYGIPKDLNGHTYGVYYAINGNNSTKPDTVGYTKLRHHYSMPATYGAGINYQWDNRLMVEADFTYQPWSKAKYNELEGFESSSFNDRYKIAVGAEFRPADRGGYFRRVRYRAGIFYNRDYIRVGDNEVRDMGVTLGLGFPVPQAKSVLNLGIAYRHRQASPVRLVTENTLEITLGINFNELWFWQNKIR